MYPGNAQFDHIKNASLDIKDRLFSIVSANPMLRGIFLIGSGSLLAQVLGIISTPIITRLYGPQDFGLFAVYLSIISVITIIASLRYELAIPLPKDEAEASSLFVLCLATVIATSFMMIGIVYLFSGSILALMGADGLKPYVWLVVPGFFVIGIYQVFIYWTIRRRNYGIITYTKVYQSVGGVASKIAFGFLSFGPWGLLLGDFISQVCGIGKIVSKTWKDDHQLIRQCSLKGLYSAAIKYRKFPLFSSSSAIINAMALQLPVLLISAFFGLKEAGYYSLSYGILFLPAMVIGTAIAQVYLGEVTVIKRNGDSGKLESLYLSIVVKLALVSIPMIGAIAIVAPTVFPVVFGGKWLEAGVYCIPIALLAISNFIMSPTSILEIYGYNHWKLVFDIIRTVSVIGCFFLAHSAGFSILNTLWIYVIVMVLAYLLYFIMNITAIRNINAKVNT